MSLAVKELALTLEDTQWEKTEITHNRHVARAIVVDEEGFFYFVRVVRDDIFGNGAFIETAGGGVETGETPEEAIHRELKEELGASVEVLCKIGTVSDYYNQIHRHNVNHYFLCLVTSFGKTEMTPKELEEFELSTLKLTYEEAAREYKQCAAKPWGVLLANRELPVLEWANQWLLSTK